MTASELIQKARSAGLLINRTLTGELRVLGDSKCLDSWLPTLREHKTELIAGLVTETSCAWLLHFADKPPSARFFAQPMTAEEVLAFNPDALAAEPYQEPVSTPDMALAPDETSILLRWLYAIDETELVDLVFKQCQTSSIQRQGWLLLANKYFESEECS